MWVHLYMDFFSNEYCKCIIYIYIYIYIYNFLNIFFSVAYFIVRIQYIIYITYKYMLMLLLRLLINSRLLVVKFWGGQKLYTDFDCVEVGVPNLHAIHLKLKKNSFVFFSITL